MMKRIPRRAADWPCGRLAADLAGQLVAHIGFDPYAVRDFEAIIAAWLPVTFALNSVNRAMGLRDLYPFILSPTVIRKLGFVHGLVQSMA